MVCFHHRQLGEFGLNPSPDLRNSLNRSLFKMSPQLSGVIYCEINHVLDILFYLFQILHEYSALENFWKRYNKVGYCINCLSVRTLFCTM